MKKGGLLAGLGLAAIGKMVFDEVRRRQARERGPATGLLDDGRPGTALITGGSSGIGATFARHLAAQGYDLVLVARGEDRLAAAADELRSQYGVAVETLVADLSEPEGIERVESRIRELDRLTLLINNAGFGTAGRFAKVDIARHEDMLNVHVVAPTRLSHAALPGMVKRRQGGIINVASIAAFVPLPGGVNYSSTKAYLLMFSQGLYAESRSRNVRVQALCPGFTYTGMHDTKDLGKDARSRVPGFLWGNAEDVVDASLAALALGQPVCVPGIKNQVMAAAARHLPTAQLIRLGQFAIRT
jgi:short-subunit dehydrogenase